MKACNGCKPTPTCSSCKHFEQEEDPNGFYQRCVADIGLGDSISEDDFCSYHEVNK